MSRLAGLTRGAGKVGGLDPSTTYHYRLVADSRGGVANGRDRNFTTLA